MTLTPPLVSGGLPGAGHALAFLRDPIGLLERGYGERGDIFSLRLGNRTGVVLIGPEHARFFFAETDKTLSIRKAYTFLAKMFDERFLFLADPAEYQRQRDLIASSFQRPQLDQHVEVMANEAHAFVAALGDEGEFDLTTRLGPLVMRVAAHAFLGRDLGGFLGYDFFGEFQHFSQGTDPVLPLWLPLPRLVRSRRAKRRLHAQLGRLIEARRQQPVHPADFLQRLVDARYADGSPVPDYFLVNIGLALMWAGQETTTGQLSWALIELLRHPPYLKDVLVELHAVIGDGLDIDVGRLGRLPILDRALQETERLHPVAHVMMRTALEPLDYAGYRLPEGCMVFAAPCVSHRVPDLFPDPEAYRPDRFAAGGGDPHDDHRLIGFGGGEHRCPGMDFALLEMKVILSLLLQKFELTLLDLDPQPVPGPRTKWPASPCRIRYRRRT